MSDARQPHTPIDPDTGLPVDASLPDMPGEQADPDLRTDAEAEQFDDDSAGDGQV